MNPSEIVEVMKQISKGKLITVVKICKKFAHNHNVRGCCSLTTGIFYIITAANVAEEAIIENRDLNIPDLANSKGWWFFKRKISWRRYGS